MRNLFRKLALLIVVVMVLSLVFTGCGSKSDSESNTSTGTQSTNSTEATADSTSTAAVANVPKPDTSKAVDLVMYLMSDGAPDVPAVYDEVNKKLKTDINATVDPQFIGWADFKNTYTLLLASGENFDLMYAATWTDFADNARKGAYKEITEDMLTKYAPLTAAYPKDVLDSGKVDGKLFGLAANKKEYGTLVYVVRGDFMKKYNIQPIKSLDDFGLYLDAIAKNEKGIIPYNTNSGNYALGGINLNELNWSSQNTLAAMFDLADPTQKAFNFLETPEALAYFTKMREWNQKGYWSKATLSNNTPDKDAFLAGTSASCIVNLSEANSVYTQVSTSNPEWDVQAFNAITKNSPSVTQYMVNGMAINANSANPERALMLLDLFKNDESYNVLTHYGLEGKHYTVNADGSIASVADSSYPADGPCPWGWNNDKFTKKLSSGLPNYYDILSEYDKNFKANPLQNFTLDATNSEIATLQPVFSDINEQYGKALGLGFVDAEKYAAEQREKVKSAGIDKYLVEVQKQVDEYLKSQTN
jgi:putative aldouronate transport system substrate-binding protein